MLRLTPDELFTVFGSSRSEKIVATRDTGCDVALIALICKSHSASAFGSNVPRSHRFCPFTLTMLQVAEPSCVCGGTAMTTIVFGAAIVPALDALTCSVTDPP